MGFLDNWRKGREEKAQIRKEQGEALAEQRKQQARSTAVLLALNTQIANSALRETEKQRTRDLSAHDRDQMARQIAGKAQAMLLATTDLIGGERITNQFLATAHGGIGQPGDFAIFCIYVSSVIKNCAGLLEWSRSRGVTSLEGKQETISVSHEEIVTGMDATLATSLTRAEWLLSNQKDLLSDYLRRLLAEALGHEGLRLAGPMTKRNLARVRSRCSV